MGIQITCEKKLSLTYLSGACCAVKKTEGDVLVLCTVYVYCDVLCGFDYSLAPQVCSLTWPLTRLTEHRQTDSRGTRAYMHTHTHSDFYLLFILNQMLPNVCSHRLDHSQVDTQTMMSLALLSGPVRSPWYALGERVLFSFL